MVVAQRGVGGYLILPLPLLKVEMSVYAEGKIVVFWRRRSTREEKEGGRGRKLHQHIQVFTSGVARPWSNSKGRVRIAVKLRPGMPGRDSEGWATAVSCCRCCSCCCRRRHRRRRRRRRGYCCCWRWRPVQQRWLRHCWSCMGFSLSLLDPLWLLKPSRMEDGTMIWAAYLSPPCGNRRDVLTWVPGAQANGMSDIALGPPHRPLNPLHSWITSFRRGTPYFAFHVYVPSIVRAPMVKCYALTSRVFHRGRGTSCFMFQVHVPKPYVIHACPDGTIKCMGCIMIIFCCNSNICYYYRLWAVLS